MDVPVISDKLFYVISVHNKLFIRSVQIHDLSATCRQTWVSLEGEERGRGRRRESTKISPLEINPLYSTIFEHNSST